MNEFYFTLTSSTDPAKLSCTLEEQLDLSLHDYEAALVKLSITNSFDYVIQSEDIGTLELVRDGAEVRFPWLDSLGVNYTKRNFNHYQNSFQETKLRKQGSTQIVQFTGRPFKKISHIVDDINKIFQEVYSPDTPPKLEYGNETINIVPGSYRWANKDDYVIIPVFGPQLSTILGTWTTHEDKFKEIVEMYYEQKTFFIPTMSWCDMKKGKYISEAHCPIIEGNIPMQSDLRIIRMIPEASVPFGYQETKSFKKPIYFNCIKKTVKSIELYLCWNDDDSSPLKFSFGQSYAIIHVRLKA